MATIITPRVRHHDTRYVRSFVLRNGNGSGWAFTCDKEGNLLSSGDDRMHPSSVENYVSCIDGTHDVTDEGVVTYVNNWTESAMLRCDCGAEVDLHGFTNTCHQCDADYNMDGQLLAPRSQWGEETGESLGDILGIDGAITDALLECAY